MVTAIKILLRFIVVVTHDVSRKSAVQPFFTPRTATRTAHFCELKFLHGKEVNLMSLTCRSIISRGAEEK